jgi:hypothetical protein
MSNVDGDRGDTIVGCRDRLLVPVAQGCYTCVSTQAF